MPYSEASPSDLVTLLPSGTVTSGTAVLSTGVAIPKMQGGIEFILDVTAAAAAVGDTLDVKVQALVGGSNGASGAWIDVIHFTQVLGNGGVKRIIAKLLAETAVAMYTDAALGGGTQKDIFGDYWRVSYSVVDGGAHGQSFTFSVIALPF